MVGSVSKKSSQDFVASDGSAPDVVGPMDGDFDAFTEEGGFQSAKRSA